MPEHEDLPVPRIETFEYLGYNGGFATRRVPLHMYVVVGVNGVRRHSRSDSWHGYVEAHWAERDARDWSEFTGWPVLRLGRQAGRDDPLKES